MIEALLVMLYDDCESCCCELDREDCFSKYLFVVRSRLFIFTLWGFLFFCLYFKVSDEKSSRLKSKGCLIIALLLLLLLLFSYLWTVDSFAFLAVMHFLLTEKSETKFVLWVNSECLLESMPIASLLLSWKVMLLLVFDRVVYKLEEGNLWWLKFA